MSIYDKLVRRPDEGPGKARSSGEADDAAYGTWEGRAGMNVQAQIDEYVADQPQPKSAEIQKLHRLILKASPDCRLWFLDGKNDEGKVVSNPNIGYGLQAIRYAGGETRDFYQVGLSANTTGISVYIMGLEDKKFLSETYGATLGKAKITGYCVKFRGLADINIDVLEEMIATHMGKRPA